MKLNFNSCALLVGRRGADSEKFRLMPWVRVLAAAVSSLHTALPELLSSDHRPSARSFQECQVCADSVI